MCADGMLFKLRWHSAFFSKCPGLCFQAFLFRIRGSRVWSVWSVTSLHVLSWGWWGIWFWKLDSLGFWIFGSFKCVKDRFIVLALGHDLDSFLDESPMACTACPPLPRLPPSLQPRFRTQWRVRSQIGGWATPLKNMKVSWDDDIPNIWKKMKKSHVPNHQPLMNSYDIHW